MTNQTAEQQDDRLGTEAILGVAGRGGGPDVQGGVQAVSESAQVALDVEGTAAEEAQRASDRTVTCWLFRGEEPPRQVGPEEIPALLSSDENFVWIDLSEYEEDDLRRLAATLHLHRTSIHSALSLWQRPRLDVFSSSPKGFFVSATVARLDPSAYRVHASQLDLFVGENYLLSAHKLPLPFAEGVMSRTYQNPQLVQHDSAFMLYIVLDELLEYYEDLNGAVQDQIERMEHRALSDASDDILEDLVNLKRYAFTLRQLAEQHRNVFEAFLRPDFPFLAGEGVDVYFRDLDGRLARLLDSLSAARDSVNGAFDIYVSHVSHRTNNIIKLLTMVSTVLLPNWLILSFFSTGFRGVVPWLYSQTSFAVMIACMVLVTVGIVYAFRRQRWI